MFCGKLKNTRGVISSLARFNCKPKCIVNHGLVRAWPTQICAIRSIYSDECLDVRKYSETATWNRLKISDGKQFQTNIYEMYSESGVKNIFKEELVNLIYLAESDDDLEMVRKILNGCLSDDIRAATAVKLYPHFFQHCFWKNKINQMLAAWNTAEFKEARLNTDGFTRRLYMVMLYRAELYEDLVDQFSEEVDALDRDDLTIILAALAKIGTLEAFKSSHEVLRKRIVGVKSSVFYAYLGFKVGQFGPAWDRLRTLRVPSIAAFNLKLSILIELGRLRDGLILLRSELPPKTHLRNDNKTKSRNLTDNTEHDHNDEDPTLYICINVVNQLNTAIRDQNDSELLREWESLCKVLDSSVKLSEYTLEELIFKPIAVIRRKNRKKEIREKNVWNNE